MKKPPNPQTPEHRNGYRLSKRPAIRRLCEIATAIYAAKLNRLMKRETNPGELKIEN